MLRGILNIGREDVDISGLVPDDKKISILGASSDHLLVNLTESINTYSIGRRISFIPNYSALLASMTSSYVEKKLLNNEKYTDSDVLFFDKISGITSDREWRLIIKNLGYEPLMPENREKNDLFAQGAKAVVSSKKITEKISVLGRAVKSIGLLWISDTPSLNENNDLYKIIETGESEGWLDTENIVLLGIQSAEKKEKENY